MIDFKGSQFEREIILWGVRWYVAYRAPRGAEME
jgi:putative transposase